MTLHRIAVAPAFIGLVFAVSATTATRLIRRRRGFCLPRSAHPPIYRLRQSND
jgi:hypothetical protein